MLEVLRKALADNNNMLMVRICTAGQKIPNERAIIAVDEIGVAVQGAHDGEFFVQPWSNIAWLAVS
ncbi:hypothetical protein [Sphingomonas bacterium]|uniref:hypothetical protein n=1 Tax=Sphingomonas bacterium TaxID=1895847 RepID=UPI0026206574|nr:hypothetical protein [Sphingomonas bacterium]MDB5678897.1 hypothetical protein [Sphingomonas bacterium]